MLRHWKTLGNSILTGCLIPSKHISDFDSQACVISTFEQRTMPSISDVRSVRMGGNCSRCFCIEFIISLLPSLSFLSAAQGDETNGEWHLVALGFATRAARALGMSVPELLAASHLKDWTIPLSGILPELLNLGLAAGTRCCCCCCCPWASRGLYKPRFRNGLWSCEAGTDEGSSVWMILATAFKIIHCSCESKVGQEESC